MSSKYLPVYCYFIAKIAGNLKAPLINIRWKTVVSKKVCNFCITIDVTGLATLAQYRKFTGRARMFGKPAKD